MSDGKLKDNQIFNSYIAEYTEKHKQLFIENDDEFLGYTALTFFRKAWEESRKQSLGEIESLEQQNKLLKETVEFYADESNWHSYGFHAKEVIHFNDMEYLNELDCLGGKKAREVLNKIKE
jgi:hypothetical protein